jgi:hypothetical protein
MKQLIFDLATKDILQCPRTVFSLLIKIKQVGKSSQDTLNDFILQYNNARAVSVPVLALLS